MKLTVPVSDLLGSVAACVRVATGGRAVAQAFTGVLLDADDGRCVLAATDATSSLRTRVPVSLETPGRALLPGRLFLDVLRSLPAETVEITVDGDGARIVSGGASFKLRTLRVEEFPALPDPPGQDRVLLPAAPFAETVGRVARAASRDDARPVLCGLLVTAEAGTLSMAATDSYRLAVRAASTPSANGAAFQMNVPRSGLDALVRAVEATDEQQSIAIASRNSTAVFEAPDGTVLSTSLIAGQFPEFRKLLPEKVAHEMRMPAAPLREVVSRIGVLTGGKENVPLRLAFEKDRLTVSAETTDVGGGVEVLPAPFTGERLEIGFNAAFLRDGLEGVQSEELVLKANGPQNPIVIEDPEDRYTYLLMPIRLD